MSEGQKTAKGKILTGRVVSTKMQKTIVVLVERLVRHPMYEKTVRRSTKLHAHDEHEEAKLGDSVSIQESRPISKTKAWKLVTILKHANEN